MTAYLAGRPSSAHLPTPGREALRVSRCCAKCRRGVPGFGDLPCGYADSRCPNGCHQIKTDQKASTT